MLTRPSDINLKNSRYSEEELVALYIQTGENYYFGLLYIKCSGSVYRHCLFLVKDAGLAQDFTHDIFLKLASALVSFNGKSQFSRWLFKVTYNHCMDHFAKIRYKAEISIDEHAEIADDTDLINLMERDSIELMNLKNALNHLPTEEKAILLMRYSNDISIHDIAVLFKTTDNAVKMRLLRSRKKLLIKCSA